jgi:hypothetical protein
LQNQLMTLVSGAQRLSLTCAKVLSLAKSVRVLAKDGEADLRLAQLI